MPTIRADPTGPRGGTSTNKKGQRKKVFWLEDELCEALRRKAFEDHQSEVAIVREALRRFLEIED